MVTKYLADKAGRKLLSLMKGMGWKLRVDQNIGWFYEVYNGTMHVHPNHYTKTPTSFYCLFGADNRYFGAGEVYWSDGNKAYADPNEAVNAQLIIAQDFINKCQLAVDNVKRNINAKPAKT